MTDKILTAEEMCYAKHTHIPEDGLEMYLTFEDAVKVAKQFATQRDKEIAEQGWDAALSRKKYNQFVNFDPGPNFAEYWEGEIPPDKQTFLSSFNKTEA